SWAQLDKARASKVTINEKKRCFLNIFIFHRAFLNSGSLHHIKSTYIKFNHHVSLASHKKTSGLPGKFRG
ncbi:MAG: hypothetical protein RL120_09320, partial [Gammaproteobacteria bacterium]